MNEPGDRDRCDTAAARKQAGLVLAMLAVATVSATRLGLRCPVRAVFGIDCPGCGGTRALGALMRGDVRQAARENVAALVAGVAVAAYVTAPRQVSQAAATARAAAASHHTTRWWAHHPQTSACVAAALWCVARNYRWPWPADRGSHSRAPWR